MADIKYISVLAVGNPAGNAGVGPIVMFNNPQFNVENDTHGGLGDNNYYFSVKIENNYTVYKLIKNNVRSLQAIRAGYLAIAFSIPRGYELVASTPYQVLMELWRDFRVSCMTLKDPVLQVYEFNTKNIDTSVLNETAKAFSLRQTNKVYRPMDNHSSETALIVQPDDKIEELLNDVQYPEFSSYKEILIAESASNSTKYKLLSDIKIPRLVSYSVIVDGSSKGYVTDKNTPITVTSTKDSAFYQNKTETFTVSEIFEGKNIPGVSIDEAKEQIIVSTIGWATPIAKKFHVHIEPSEAEEYFVRHRELLSITRDGYPVQLDNNFNFSLSGTELKSQIGYTIGRNCEYKAKSAELLEKELKIVVEKIVTTPRTVGGGIKKKYPHATFPKEQKETKVVEIKIIAAKQLLNELSSRYLTIRCKTNDSEVPIQTSQIALVQSNEPNVLEGHLFVPKEWSNRFVYLSFCTHTYRYDSSSQIDFRKEESLFNIKNDFKKTKRKKVSLKAIIAIVVILVTLLLGFIGGYGSHCLVNKWHNSEGTVTQDTTGVTEDSLQHNTDYGDTDFTSADIAKRFLAKADSTLKKKNVTFDEIHNLKDSYEEAYKEWDSENKIYNKICAYNDLVNSIENGNINQAIKLAKGEMISSQHANLVRLLDNTNYIGVVSFCSIHKSQAVEEISNVHTQKKDEVICPNCKKLVERTGLRTHILKMHPHICSRCKQKFESQEELTTHLRDCER